MDIEQYWQRNRRFVLQVAGGLLGFLVLNLVISRTVGSDLRRSQGELASQRAKLQRLSADGFGAAERNSAEEDHQALGRAIAELAARVEYAPGSELAAAIAKPTPASYLSSVARVREELLQRASRADVEIEPGLGLPEISPTRPEEIGRTLEALDAIERVARAGIEAGITRLDKLKIRLDPGLYGRRGSGALERTHVDLRLTGDNAAVLATLLATQRPAGPGQRALMIDSAKATPERDRPEELRLEVTLVLARLYDPVPDEPLP